MAKNKEISDVTENTLRIIKAANRSLQFHQDRLGKTKMVESQENLQFKSQNKVGLRDLWSPSFKPMQAKSTKEVEVIPKRSYDEESIEKTQEKVRELEDRISKILEYSSALEETLKQNINQTNKISKNHCCCNKQTQNKKLYELKITSLVKDVINSLNKKKIQPQVKSCIIRPKTRSKPSSSPLIPISTIEYLSNFILELCIEDILTSLDTSLHNFSIKFVKGNYCETETSP
ncbi:uncharacterized protein ELE39_002486 [Cryptosporidium sp. chipmunk genotype I]|uniref:uncharacterized protein n=1 Tax=Cryptosporidium sp. chipmunk genotype I TaxID=1280935 RepID=UPI003519FE5C|nr:hypothetical protein ELE39_002486 [Cryptosporidium sp. chipmunk genotype I]